MFISLKFYCVKNYLIKRLWGFLLFICLFYFLPFFAGQKSTEEFGFLLQKQLSWGFDK